jgi:hypothetical protein
LSNVHRPSSADTARLAWVRAFVRVSLLQAS